MPFLRIFQHLLPDAVAFRLSVGKKLRKFFKGLTGAQQDVKDFVDLVWEDLLPETTRFLELWEKQWGLPGTGSDSERRDRLAATWQALGGQSPRYLQDIVQAAGFPLYVYEWWSSGPDPYVARDPRLYTTTPLIGTVQCGEPLAQCGEPTALSNAFLVNDPGYLVNKDLTRRAPPPVPDDPDTWPYFLYFGDDTFGESALISPSRRAELEELLLSICPTQHWIVLMVTSDLWVTHDDETIVDETGEPFAV